MLHFEILRENRARSKGVPRFAQTNMVQHVFKRRGENRVKRFRARFPRRNQKQRSVRLA